MYRASEQLSPLNTYQLRIWRPHFGILAPEALAVYIDAIDYYEANAQRVLKETAERLRLEDPRKLVLRMLQDLVEDLKEDLADVHDPETSEPQHRKKTEQRLKELRRFVYSELGLGAGFWEIPQSPDDNGHLEPSSWVHVEEALAEHVFGTHFLEVVTAEPLAPSARQLITAGSDGSSHAGYVRGIPAPAYVEEEGRLILTFNNSVAYVELPEGYSIDFPYHGVPMTRAALEDPHNRGMIIARPWFPDLTDSDYEHMKKAALDVVQFRVDERLMRGTARAYGTSAGRGDSGLLPRPNVLIRDGTVTPQEREFQHYVDPTAYGDIVREGIALSYSVLKVVADSTRRVFGGAVKFTQLRSFSRILNWYIRRGSGHDGAKPIEPSWDIARASHVSDSVAMTRLIQALPTLSGRRYYRSCIIVRPFPAMVTSLRELNKRTPDEWLGYFEDRRDAQVREQRRNGGLRPYLAKVNLEDEPYVGMCREADYGAFYFGRPGGDPQLTLPRFEFMDSLRGRPPDECERRVLNAVALMISGIDETRWQLDKDHNFLSSRKMPRLVPYVVYEAHEKCKALGHKLEAELRQAIAMRLSQLKALRGLPVPKVEIEPISIKAYLSNAVLLRSSSSEEPEND